MNSRPAMYSSTSAGWRYFSTQILTAARSSSSVSTTLVESMPLLEPSAFGFTISGNFMSGDSRSRADSMSWNFGVRMSCWSSTFLPSALSSAIARVAESEPVYGMPSSSHSAGTCASRFRPSTPSAMLKIRSTSASASTRGRSGRGLEVDDDVALARERVGDRDDRLRRIPLGLVVAGLAALDVVGEADADRLRLALRRVDRRAGSRSRGPSAARPR